MRGTGGNRFIEAGSTRIELMRAIARGLDDLEDWFEDTDRETDIGALSVEAKRIPSGAISVEVSTDSKKRDECPTHAGEWADACRACAADRKAEGA